MVRPEQPRPAGSPKTTSSPVLSPHSKRQDTSSHPCKSSAPAGAPPTSKPGRWFARPSASTPSRPKPTGKRPPPTPSGSGTCGTSHGFDVGGEPVKVGHHSERRHTNAIDKAHNSARRGIEAHREAEEAARRAEAAARTTGGRYDPVTVANRIEKIAADIRRYERRIVEDAYDPEKGYQPASAEQKAARAQRYSPTLAALRGQLDYWQQVRTDQIAAGKAPGYSLENISKGDAVKIRGHWRKVVRVNAKTVSVETGYTWTDRATYAEIHDHRAAEATQL